MPETSIEKHSHAEEGGIYFHIPFCKQACHYCDFHFVTTLKHKDDMLNAMAKEIIIQRENAFFKTGTRIKSVYFGGGTPSVLNGEDIRSLLGLINTHFEQAENQEITLEANPDDLSAEKILAFKEAGVNRFSIGVQSFFDEDLRWMNRAHCAEEAKSALKRVLDAGFTNITADLIYGFPLLTKEKWEANINQMIDLNIPHLSAYSMTVEPRTALGTFVRTGKEPGMDDEQSGLQFEYLMDRLKEAGYQHYEISNWAKSGFEAIHNGNYWKGKSYLGIGPSAHSFDGQHRYWNIRNNAKYMKDISAGKLPFEKESLSVEDQLNEYIMLSLRTSWGLHLPKVIRLFGEDRAIILKAGLDRFALNGLVTTKEVDSTTFVLTRKGRLMADYIASELFF